MEDGVWQLEGTAFSSQKMSASHLLVHAWYASTIFVFLIIFIFIKRLNYPSIKLIITKKQSWNTKRSLSVSLKFFTLTRNIVISLCNQSIKRPKIPWIQVIYILLLRVFKLFNCAYIMLKDQFVSNQYDSDK
jgi:hypothetical protein